MNKKILITVMLASVVDASFVFAKDSSEQKEVIKSSVNDAEWADVSKIKEKYWARGDDSELGVVQNRIYSKENKIEAAVFAGILSTDPFLSVNTVGGLVGYHLTEYISFNLLGWTDIVNPSTALKTFQDYSGATANVNIPKSFYGSEANISLLYGKLSILGKAIIYYDFNFIGGLGLTNTESGKNFTPYAGIGQQVYLSKLMSLRFDYRIMHYNENILEKEITPKLGQIVGERGNWTHSFNLGVSFLFGGRAK